MIKKVGGLTKLAEQKPVEMFPGIFRRTMSYNNETMLCHFTLGKGTNIPLHKHVAAQNGYVLKGKLRFFTEDGRDIIVVAGDGYVFDSEELHGSEMLEDSEIIECFSPMRPEYLSK
jgi:quercetin dioxygenase-like cupin family protein